MTNWELFKVSDTELDELRSWLYRAIDYSAPGWMTILYNEVVKEQHKRMR